MSVKFFPATYGHYIVTLAVKQGYRMRFRNVHLKITAADPDGTAKVLAEDIERQSHGRMYALKKVMGREFSDASSAYKPEPTSPIMGMGVLSAGKHIKEKVFVNVPWVREEITPTAFSNWVETIPGAILEQRNTVTGGVADLDNVIPANASKFGRLDIMNPEPDQAEVGDVDSDEGADGILGEGNTL